MNKFKKKTVNNILAIYSGKSQYEPDFFLKKMIILRLCSYSFKYVGIFIFNLYPIVIHKIYVVKINRTKISVSMYAL